MNLVTAGEPRMLGSQHGVSVVRSLVTKRVLDSRRATEPEMLSWPGHGEPGMIGALRFHRWIRSIFITQGTSPISPPFDWLRSLFCVDLVNLLQTLGVDLVVCIYDTFIMHLCQGLGLC